MMTKKGMGVCAVAGVAVLALGTSLVSSSFAQAGGPQGVGGGFGQGPGRPGEPGGQGGMMPPGGRGFGPTPPAAMISDNTHLYVLLGNRLFKVRKDNLDTVDQSELRMPRPGGEGGPPRFGGGGGGGKK